MKPSRNIWIWVALEIIVALVIHWVLLEMGRGFAGTRAWWARFTGSPHRFSGKTGLPPSTDVRNDFFRN